MVVIARPGPDLVFKPEPVAVFCLKHIIRSWTPGLLARPVNQDLLYVFFFFLRQNLSRIEMIHICHSGEYKFLL